MQQSSGAGEWAPFPLETQQPVQLRGLAADRELLRINLSPEQVSGRLRRDGLLLVSHETIYTHVWRDKRRDGRLYRRLRQRTTYRKRYGSYEKRGRLPGKRHITERPPAVEHRQEF